MRVLHQQYVRTSSELLESLSYNAMSEKKFRPYELTINENRLRRAVKNYGRSFRFLDSSLNDLLENWRADKMKGSLGNYLSLVDTFGERNLSKEAQLILSDILKSEDLNLDDCVRSNDASLQLTKLTRVKNLYKRFCDQKKMECKLTNEEISDNLKQALVALQSSPRSFIHVPNDNMSILVELGKVNRAIILENSTLIKETLNVILEKNKNKG